MDPWRSRAVIIHKDENGYGLTLCGDNPVSVQTIKRGGASEVAGIREGDIIIKVNGAIVENMNHTEVVNLIKSAGPYVTLTVKPQDMISMPGVGLISGNGARPHHMQTPNERVTAPLPVNQDVQLQMQGSKLRTLQAMRDKAAADVEMLWKRYEVSQNPRDMNDFEKAQQGLKKIECQMKTFRQSSPNLQLHSPAPFNPSPQSHHSVAFQPYPGVYLPGQAPPPPQQGNIPSAGVPGNGNRNRNPLSAQSSVPTYLNTSPSQRPWGDYNNAQELPPPLPPRSYSTEHPNYPPGYSPHDPLVAGGYPPYLPSNIPSSATTNNHSHSGHALKNYPSACLNNDVLNNKSPNSSLSSGQSHHSQQQTHHRTKSSPDPVSMQKALNSAEASRRSDSVSDLSKNNNSRSRSSVVWDSVDSNRLSPPGSPPPPYGKHHESENNVFNEENHSYNNVNHTVSDFSPTKTLAGALSNRANPLSAVDIISMEEDDGLFSRDLVNASSVTGKHGPYSSLSKLLEHNAHLAVFMNYVIDNRCDPSSLLFYLLTGLYIEEGNIKEMKRWGYEIHSTFTAPGSPLLVPHVDENIATEIDDALVHESDKEEMMRRVFRKARNKAKEEINKQLEEFCNKKTAGLGSMFGPPDSQLEESLHDKAKELWIVENYLLPRLVQLYDDWEQKNDDRTLAIVNAVSTVLQKQFGIRSQSSNSVIEKCNSFVSKEKSMRSKFMSKNKKVTFNGHHFTPQYYHSYTECNICCKLLWGVGPQGFQCMDCNVNIHRHCTNQIQDNCLGSSQKKDKANDKFRKFKEKIRPEKDPKRRSSSNWSMKKYAEESLGHFASGDIDQGDRPLANSGSSSSNLKNNLRPDTVSEERLANDGFSYEGEDVDHVHQEPRRSSNAVGRSESCKERVQRKQTRERRKHSDPNLTSKSSDVDLDSQRHLSDANNSGSSSNSSLSARSLDSPSTSLELVAASNNSSSSLPGRNSETPETTVGHSGVSDSYKPSPGWEGDSDIEIEQDPPDWTKNVPEETLSRLDRLEKKRQEVLNELFHTERSHVRNLKVVDRLFHRPIRQQQLLPPELIQMLFANLEEMLEIHGQFNAALKKKRAESPLVGDIGPVLLEMFDGERGENFKNAAANFCSRQQIGLEALRERRRKDPKFNAFLSEAESDPVCRRLGIKDMIPMAMQRLTKYPLLFDNLCDCTTPDSVEYKGIQRAVDMSKEILCSVNLAKKEAEDYERLVEIQRRLDKSSFEKGADRNDASSHELRNLDFTRHKLIYEGPLMWRMTKANRQKSDQHDVHAVLLQDMVVLLLKQDDRLVLKIHNVGFPGKTEKISARPIIKITNLISRPVATDKKAFFLISTTSSNMYELVCPTAEERKIWLQHITKAADDFKSRQQESRRPELHQNTNIPTAVPEAEDRTRESEGGEGVVSGDVTAEGDSNATHEPSGVSPLSQNKDASPAPDNANASIPPNSSTEAPTSPESQRNPAGDGKLGVGIKRVASASPNQTRRQQGEFLRVTESSPLIDPSEVVVATRDVQFAQPVISPHGLPPLHPIITRATSSVSATSSDTPLPSTNTKTKDSLTSPGGDEAPAPPLALLTTAPQTPPTNTHTSSHTLPTSHQTPPPHTPGANNHTQGPGDSPTKELRRADSLLHKAFEDKLKIVSKIYHIPPEDSEHSGENLAIDAPKDTKELVVACMHQVDQLGRLFANQKITNENLSLHREQLNIHKSLNNLLTQLLSEVHRRDDDLELRRQELHRVREQNHGYQERLQTRAKVERQPSPGNLSSPTLSPTQSRPNSFLSVSSSSDHHECHQDDEPVMMKAPLKPQLSAPVATSSFNSTSPQPTNETSISFENSVTSKTEGSQSHHYNSASDLAQDEFADAVEELVTTESDSSIETNRESTETEVSMKKEPLTSSQKPVGKNGEEEDKEDDLKSSTATSSTSTLNESDVPESLVEKKETEEDTLVGKGELTNGHHQATAAKLSPELISECKNGFVKDANCLEGKEEKGEGEESAGAKKIEVEVDSALSETSPGNN